VSRYVWVLVAIGLSVLVATAAVQPAPPQRNKDIEELEKLIAGKEQQPAEQVFKNIQVFKGMPAIRVLRIMEQAFIANLGVECSYCHTTGEWESDSKREKVVAREMWTMRGEVQQKLRQITGKSDLPFTCYSCHKGQAKPAFAQ
jgi:Photosynthetic reaction centre cytochrome C subunit